MPSHPLTIFSTSDWFRVTINSNATFTSVGRNDLSVSSTGPLGATISLMMKPRVLNMGRNIAGQVTVTCNIDTALQSVDITVCKGNIGDVRVHSEADNGVNNAVLGDGQNCLNFNLALTHAKRREKEDEYDKQAAES